MDGLTEPDSTSSNAPDPAATSAPADVEQPGTGVGAIVGEEPNRCVNFCVCSNCNELEIDNESEIYNESVIECDLEIESENERSIQEQSENRGYPSDFPHPQFTTNWPGTSVTVAPILNGRTPT